MSPRLLLTVLLLSSTTFAELPVARLQSIFPTGGQIGTRVEVKVEGADLDDATELRFSAPGFSSTRAATNPAGIFAVQIDKGVRPGLYEVRVLGRFGFSNPRFFTVGSVPEVTGATTNRSLSTAVAVPAECTINAIAPASAADFYRFEAKAGQRYFLTCRSEPLDSKMRPNLFLYDADGAELLRDRTEGRLQFACEKSSTLYVKVHDSQFRGGSQFPYRLTITAQPQLSFIFPPARSPGADRQFSAFGPGLPENGAPLEITVPKAATNVSRALRLHRLADCLLNTFDYDSPGGPTEISVATAPALLEKEPNNSPGNAQQISVPSEIQGHFFPKDDVDYYEFSAPKGEVLTIEVVSERLGLSTDPFVLVQSVSTNSEGHEVTSDLQEMYDSEGNFGGPLFDTSSRDPSWRLEAAADMRVRVQIRDLFNHGADSSRVYRLSIRRESPDFRLVATIAPPPNFDREKREAAVWSSFLRRDDTLLLKVLAFRQDNFKGEIALALDGAPAGVRASESVIPEGQNSTWLTLSSDERSSEWSGAIRILGRAKVNGRELLRPAATATIIWDVPDYNNETVVSRLTQETALALSAEAAPFRLSTSNTVWQVSQSGMLALPWSISRTTEFKEPAKVRAYLDTQNDPIREWDIDGQVAQTHLELDLKQMKIATGSHQLFLLAQTKGKIRRVRAEEVADLESAEKAAKEEPEKKRLQELLKWHEVTATFPSPIVKLIVNPAPTAAK